MMQRQNTEKRKHTQIEFVIDRPLVQSICIQQASSFHHHLASLTQISASLSQKNQQIRTFINSLAPKTHPISHSKSKQTDPPTKTPAQKLQFNKPQHIAPAKSLDWKSPAVAKCQLNKVDKNLGNRTSQLMRKRKEKLKKVSKRYVVYRVGKDINCTLCKHN